MTVIFFVAFVFFVVEGFSPRLRVSQNVAVPATLRSRLERFWFKCARETTPSPP